MNAKTLMARIIGAWACSLIAGIPAPGMPGPTCNPGPEALARAAAASWQIPLNFEANQGQMDPAVKFLARGSGFNLFLTANQAVFVWQNREAGSQEPRQEDGGVLRMRLVGAKENPEVTGLQLFEGRVNYFRGNDPSHWHTDIATYAKVKYAGVYPGVDWIYYGNQREMEYDFVVAPGVDPQLISLSFAGAQRLWVDAQGNLVVQAAGGQIGHHRPLAYQEINGVRRNIPARFVLGTGDGVVGFQIGAYEPSCPLIIDPVLSFASYLGGSGEDQAYGIALDREGNIYVAGQTDSLDFPSSHPVQANQGGKFDVFVAKLNAGGSALVYSTFLGGNAVDRGFSIAVDAAGNAVVAGVTLSTNFPTVKAFQSQFGGGDRDGFVAKLDASGSALVFATYLGGSSSDEFSSVAVDRSGNIYGAGDTASTNFPTLNPVQAANHGEVEAAVAKFSPTGSLQYSSYLGGSGPYDSAIGIAVDSAGSAYLTGYTSSTNFPMLHPLPMVHRGGYEAFVAKLNPAGSALVYSTFLGGSKDDVGRSIAVDPAGNAYVSGDTFSPDFPTVSPLQATNAGGRDVFVTKINPTGSALVYSSYLGGAGEELGGVAVDSSGCAWLVGVTSSTNFPIANAVQPVFGGGTWDAFVARLNPSGSALVYSAFLGGEGDDQVSPIAVDSAGNIYVAGATTSTNFPTAKPFQANHQGGNYDAFVAKISDTGPAPAQPVAPLAEPVVAKKADTNALPASPAPPPFDPLLLQHKLFGTNLIANGDAETGPASVSSYRSVPVPGWTLTNHLTVLRYGAPGGFPSTNEPGPAERGRNLFVGGPDDAVSGAHQTIDVKELGPVIDADQARYQLAGYLGGVTGQNDNAILEARFKDAKDTLLGQAALGPATLSERNYRTALLSKNAAGPVPVGTRKIEVRLQMNRVDGFYNDAFADNLSLVLTPAKQKP